MKKKMAQITLSCLFQGGLFLGLGIGFILEQLVGWMFLGLGLGFMLMVFAQKNQ